MKKIFVALLIMIIGFTVIPAQDEEKNTGKESAADAGKKKCKARLIGAPIVFYTPETHMAFGAAGSYISRLSDCDEKVRPSSLSTILIYTMKKQFKAVVDADIYLKHNDYRIQTEFRGEKYPNTFFGVGNNTLESSEESYTSRSTGFSLAVAKRIGDGINVGIQYHFSDWDLVVVEAGGLLDSGILTGSRGGTISGAGFLVNLDNRDNIFSAARGHLIELSVSTYHKILGSKFNFTSLSLDIREYFTLFSNHVLAFQSLVKIQTGDVPFLNLAQMGGQYNMRGYFEGRFRDKNLLAFQAEYRLPVVWRLGLVGFAGLGQVAEKFNKLSLAGMKYSYGFGIRFLFDPKEKIQIRMDLGFGKDSKGFYFSIFEAF